MKFIKKNSISIFFALSSCIFLVLWLTSNKKYIDAVSSNKLSSKTKHFFYQIVNDSIQIEDIKLDSVRYYLDENDFEIYELLYQLKKENSILQQDLYQVYQELNDSIYMLSNEVNIKQNLMSTQKQKNEMIKKLSSEIQLKSNFYDSIMTVMENQMKNVENELKEVKFNKNSEGFLNFKSVTGVTIFYVGEINAENKAEGQGVALWETGHRYEGSWLNGLKHGQGIYYYKNGDRYEGNYEKNLRNGFGTYYFVNGDCYSGEWKDDQRNGLGKIITSKGQVKQEGNWIKDKFVSVVN